MFNMYREDETPKTSKSLKAIIKEFFYDLKLNYECSAGHRKKLIKQMTKLIQEVDHTDLETMEKIRSTISKYELETRM